MTAIEVRKPGLSTTVQDRGRSGYYHLGIPPSGALDMYSPEVANALVGNTPDAAVLEIVYMGPELRFTGPAVVAVTGAEIAPRVNGEARPQWESFAVAEGDVLDFDYLKAGARAYLAVSGGLDTRVDLGSRATYVIGSLGGVDGRPVAEGDVLPVGDGGTGRPGRVLPAALRPVMAKDVEVRVVMGLYDHRLTDTGRATFLDTTWTLTPVADRMGFRYAGGQLETVDREPPFGAGQDPSNIVDSPYPIGSIQVPGGVEPIVLHRDAVSGGGYMMVATVISGDLDVVAQSAPRTRTRFVEVDLETALGLRAERKDRIARMYAALGD
ncbi:MULTISPECIES: biotin-dependent carboxyltransferase family protein [unclassified Pseudonocardia]|uniref:5-oxoprolinase subunit C family protein n=1 Tax=unclassified Pseudonocardia TaxID=2619320 RepID=UPI0001FFF0F0|nr:MULTISPECIES: biotin-dependent carboxyltransferase family protein [unclassified Pseudonocardia]ALL76994.1 allophanate hydrolase [Pseudonocardia sp. EC080610-09]ALL84025.1 allophanate hydrolase [Pseudonocardia sp. EC080619-01]OLM18549.1 Allophanate hydrolase 2 subunit 2 [Pseudonocardia sp. Ae707_Ps1]